MHLREKTFGWRETLSLAACVLISIAGLATYQYVDTSTNERAYQELIEHAQTIATLIDPNAIESLSLSQDDLVNPVYVELKKNLLELREKNQRIRFIYLMAKRDDKVYFIVDSEDPSSKDYSPPGQEYTEASPELLRGWDPNVPYVLEVDDDRWGHWISALAPIRNAYGHTVALVGLDQDAEGHKRVFIIQTVIIFLGTFALLSLVGVLYLLNKREQELSDMKADFVAVAAHELRSPLTTIRWNLATLLKEIPLDDAVRRSLDELYKKVCSLIELTNSFLLSASVDHGIAQSANIAVFDVNSVLAETIAQARTMAEQKHINIENALDQHVPISVKGDRERLRLVFDNLISNAIKYSPEGSVVSISHAREGKMETFTIHDQGIGIPKEDIGKIFGGFHRAANALSSKVAGSGFGLYMAKKIVEAHGGTITCESEVHKGTTFIVALPAV